MGRVSTCQKNCKTIVLRGAQVKEETDSIGHWASDCLTKIYERSH